jgi:phage gp36-like protein
MAYCTFQNLVDTYGLPVLERLASRRDDPSNIDPAVIEARVVASTEKASAFMDGFFQVLHVVPILTNVPSGQMLLRSCSEQMTISDLLTTRGYLPRSEDETLVIATDRWRSWLRSVADGKATIPGVIVSDTSGLGSLPALGFVVNSEPSFFQFNPDYMEDAIYSENRDRFA